MKKAKSQLVYVQDKVVKSILSEIIDELERISNIEPVRDDVKSMSVAINKITSKIK